MDDQALQFLKNYMNHPAPSGFELKSQEIWLNYIKAYVDEGYLDHFNNAIAVINPDAKFKVMLESHGDEISWLVNYINPKGFLHVIPNGGGDPQVCPGKDALIHTRNGTLPCVFGWPPIHLRWGSPLKVDEEHLFVDCGCSSAEEVNALGIQVGDAITFTNQMQIINNKFVVGRGLDNRTGALIIAEVARQLKEKNIQLPFGVYFVNAVQEEVGLNGAKMVSDQIKPNIALVTDVTHDTNIPFIDVRKHGDTRCGKGPVLAIAPAIHKGILQLTEDVAAENKIPFQFVAISRETNTDADAIALSQGGICSVLISPPLRYMHTPVEMVCCDDIKHTIQLMVAILKKIDPENINLTNEFSGNAFA